MSDREGTGAEEEIEAIGSKIREQIERLRKEKEERLRKMLSFDQVSFCFLVMFYLILTIESSNSTW